MALKILDVIIVVEINGQRVQLPFGQLSEMMGLVAIPFKGGKLTGEVVPAQTPAPHPQSVAARIMQAPQAPQVGGPGRCPSCGAAFKLHHEVVANLCANCGPGSALWQSQGKGGPVGAPNGLTIQVVDPGPGGAGLPTGPMVPIGTVQDGGVSGPGMMQVVASAPPSLPPPSGLSMEPVSSVPSIGPTQGSSMEVVSQPGPLTADAGGCGGCVMEKLRIPGVVSHSCGKAPPVET